MKKQSLLFRFILPLLFWLLVWFGVYKIVNNDVLLASPLQVARRFAFVAEPTFWQTIGGTLLRTLMAYGVGILSACILSVLCHIFPVADWLFRPLLSAVRATPVASFIILSLVWLTSSRVPILAGALMVLPVVFGNLREGFLSADPKLLEMAKLFRFTPLQTWRRIIIPSAMPTFRAACESCVGLCLKATIAAEVIGVPKAAIGTQLYNAKIYLETDSLLAWTALLILLSMGMEKGIRFLLKRGFRHVRHA